MRPRESVWEVRKEERAQMMAVGAETGQLTRTTMWLRERREVSQGRGGWRGERGSEG